MSLSRYCYSILVTCSLLLGGCSTTNHQAFFDAHEKRFKAKNNYQTHFIHRKLGKIYAREFGKKSDKPTLILMHGFPDNLHLYDRLIPELSKDLHIISFDFIGWGNSDKPKNNRYDFESLKLDLDTVVKYFKLDSVVLVIHDASGIPGIDWALDNPRIIAGLVLLNTMYSPMPALKAPEAIQLFSTPGIQRTVSILATSLSDALWIKHYNEQIGKFIHSKELREYYIKILSYQSLEIRNAFYGLNDVLQASVRERVKMIPKLKSFKRPVLIAFGDDDPYLNSDVAQEFHKIFPNSKLALVKNAGHFVQIDAPKRIAYLIDSFLQSINTTHLNEEKRQCRQSIKQMFL